jgi:hypothetical protein
MAASIRSARGVPGFGLSAVARVCRVDIRDSRIAIRATATGLRSSPPAVLCSRRPRPIFIGGWRRIRIAEPWPWPAFSAPDYRQNWTALSGQVPDRRSGIVLSTARHRTSPSEGGHAGLQTQGAAPSKPPLSPSFHFPLDPLRQLRPSDPSTAAPASTSSGAASLSPPPSAGVLNRCPRPL